jgi:hypothetical protein
LTFGPDLSPFIMIEVAISVEAFEAIARTLPLGTVGYQSEPNERGERTVWLQDAMADRDRASRLSHP